MKLTDANVYLIEHKLIQDMCRGYFETGNPDTIRDTTMYIAGANDMAQAVVEALREVKDV